MRVWVDDRLVDRAQARVSAFDHGVTVGDGVFETAKVRDGVPFALTRHLQRLAVSAAGLGLPEPDLDLVRRAVDETIADSGRAGGQRVRITYTGGESPLGSDRGEGPPTLLVALAPLRSWPATAAVSVVPWTRNERSPTAGLKTTSYADNVVALATARAAGADEALLANTRGELCEGTGSNVFLVRDGVAVTPPPSSGCLAGVTRALLLEWTDAREQVLSMADLADADEVFLVSSTRDVQAVGSVDDRVLATAPGQVTTRYARVFAERAGADPDP